MVLNPVRRTMARPAASSSLPSCGRRARMILVPQNKKCLASSGAMEVDERLIKPIASFVAGIFDTGTDSPDKYEISQAMIGGK